MNIKGMQYLKNLININSSSLEDAQIEKRFTLF